MNKKIVTGFLCCMQLLPSMVVSAKAEVELTQLPIQLKKSIDTEDAPDKLNCISSGYYKHQELSSLDTKTKIKKLLNSNKLLEQKQEEVLLETPPAEELPEETEKVRVVIEDDGTNDISYVAETESIADSELEYLGNFRITHYCACSTCCGQWANGITASGTTATANRTIAVNPSQIPYGTKVLINGQVYIAEDSGGGINSNCIDIYVSSHSEALNKGMYYTDVYLVK